MEPLLHPSIARRRVRESTSGASRGCEDSLAAHQRLVLHLNLPEAHAQSLGPPSHGITLTPDGSMLFVIDVPNGYSTRTTSHVSRSSRHVMWRTSRCTIPSSVTKRRAAEIAAAPSGF